MWTPRLRDLFDLEYLHRFTMLITNFNGMIMIFGGSSLGAGAFSVMLSALKYITGLNFQYCDARWGFFGHVASLCRMINTGEIRKLHWNINTWKDEEVLAWKKSYMSACTAIQVSV